MAASIDAYGQEDVPLFCEQCNGLLLHAIAMCVSLLLLAGCLCEPKSYHIAHGVDWPYLATF